MAKAYLAPVLKQLRAEVDRSHPKRDRRSDGWYGDEAHAASKSDHNPDTRQGGVVRAFDVDKDGVNMNLLLSVVIKNPATNYVIWNGHIYSRKHGFRKRVYNGKNKHTAHMHISIRHGKSYEERTQNWGYEAAAPRPTPKPGPAPKPVRVTAEALQRAVRTTADGAWGVTTDKHSNAVRKASSAGGTEFPYGVKFAQRVVGAATDGEWGPKSVEAHAKTVTAMQKALKVMGHDPKSTDGVWGPNTESAYQAARKQFRR